MLLIFCWRVKEILQVRSKEVFSPLHLLLTFLRIDLCIKLWDDRNIFQVKLSEEGNREDVWWSCSINWHVLDAIVIKFRKPFLHLLRRISRLFMLVFECTYYWLSIEIASSLWFLLKEVSTFDLLLSLYLTSKIRVAVISRTELSHWLHLHCFLELLATFLQNIF